MGATIVDKDKGFAQITKEIQALKGRSVKVGIMDGGGGTKGASVLENAMYNEFGTSRIPPRPFMQTTYDQNEAEVRKFIDFLADKIAVGQLDASRALKLMGEDYQLRIQKTIRNAKDWAVPNDPKTIEMKGSSSPLID